MDVPYTHEHIGDSELLRFESELNSRRRATRDSSGLIFLQPPQLTDTDPPPLVSSVKNIQLSDLNSGPYALRHDCPTNQPVLEYLQWLQALSLTLETLILSSSMGSRRTSLQHEIEKEVSRVEILKAEEWKRQHRDQSYARQLAENGQVPIVSTGIVNSVGLIAQTLSVSL